MQLHANSILNPDEIQTFKTSEIPPSAQKISRNLNTDKRDIQLLFRKQSASEFIGTVRPGMHLFGFSKGQFSLIDVIETISDQIGRCSFILSTWTAASADLSRLQTIVEQDRFTHVRFLFDFSFQRRQPGLLSTIRKKYGSASVRVLKNHAKFMVFQNDRINLVVRTSMNLNFNPRLEDIDIADDPELASFLRTLTDTIFDKLNHEAQVTQTVRQHNLEFSRL